VAVTVVGVVVAVVVVVVVVVSSSWGMVVVLGDTGGDGGVASSLWSLIESLAPPLLIPKNSKGDNDDDTGKVGTVILVLPILEEEGTIAALFVIVE